VGDVDKAAFSLSKIFRGLFYAPVTVGVKAWLDKRKIGKGVGSSQRNWLDVVYLVFFNFCRNAGYSDGGVAVVFV